MKAVAKKASRAITKTWDKVILFYLMLYGKAYAVEDIRDLLDKFRDLLIYGANVVGPAIGLILVITGFLKLRRRDDDPRSASAAIWYIIAGVGIGLGSFIFLLLTRYFGEGHTSGDSYSIGSPVIE